MKDKEVIDKLLEESLKRLIKKGGLTEEQVREIIRSYESVL